MPALLLGRNDFWLVLGRSVKCSDSGRRSLLYVWVNTTPDRAGSHSASLNQQNKCYSPRKAFYNSKTGKHRWAHGGAPQQSHACVWRSGCRDSVHGDVNVTDAFAITAPGQSQSPHPYRCSTLQVRHRPSLMCAYHPNYIDTQSSGHNHATSDSSSLPTTQESVPEQSSIKTHVCRYSTPNQNCLVCHFTSVEHEL